MFPSFSYQLAALEEKKIGFALPSKAVPIVYGGEGGLYGNSE